MAPISSDIFSDVDEREKAPKDPKALSTQPHFYGEILC
jgi:hypothetical protein